VKVFAEGGQLMPPGVPELRKPVQEDNQFIAAATLYVMQPDAVDGRKPVANRGH
jgi:hypothetical protein